MDNISSFLDGSALTALGSRGLLEFIVAVAVSMVLSFGYVVFYRLNFKGSQLDESLYRSFMLLAPAVTSIFWVIQFSLPLSLGLLGALSFVRFRTPVKRAEDIAFILLVIASGLACAVYQFAIAGVLLVIVGCYTWLKGRFGARLWRPSRQASLIVSAQPTGGNSEGLVTAITTSISQTVGTPPEIVSTSSDEGAFTVHLTLALPPDGDHELLLRSLQQINRVDTVDLYYS